MGGAPDVILRRLITMGAGSELSSGRPALAANRDRFDSR
jgi:hypothetical protein